MRRNKARCSGLSAPSLKNAPSSTWLSCPPDGPFGWWMMNAWPLVGSRPRNQESPLGPRYSSRRSDTWASSMLLAKHIGAGARARAARQCGVMACHIQTETLPTSVQLVGQLEFVEFTNSRPACPPPPPSQCRSSAWRARRGRLGRRSVMQAAPPCRVPGVAAQPA
jgi:hypothetical protein